MGKRREPQTALDRRALLKGAADVHGARPGPWPGLALAKSRHGVVVVTGDGSVLMNLGCLVTLADHPAHFAGITREDCQIEKLAILPRDPCKVPRVRSKEHTP